MKKAMIIIIIQQIADRLDAEILRLNENLPYSVTKRPMVKQYVGPIQLFGNPLPQDAANPDNYIEIPSEHTDLVHLRNFHDDLIEMIDTLGNDNGE